MEQQLQQLFLTPLSGKLIKNDQTGSYVVSPFFSLDEASSYLGIGVSAIRDLVRKGELVKRHTGSNPYHIEDLNQWSELMKFRAIANHFDAAEHNQRMINISKANSESLLSAEVFSKTPVAIL